jgi:uncharacterized protein YraI
MTQHLHKRWAIILMLAVLTMLPMSIVPAFAQPQYTVPIVVVNTSFLNVRSGPGVQYSALVTLVGGTELPVLGVGSDGVWYLVSTPLGIGWVNVEFTLPRGNFSVVPSINVNALEAQLIAPASIPTIALDAGQGGGSVATATAAVERFRGFLIVDNVNLRVAPADGAGAITILRTGVDRLDDFAIVGRSRDANNLEWVALDVPNVGIGWVEAAKVDTRLSARYATVVTVTATEFGLTSGPAGGNLVDPVIVQRDDEVFLIGVSADGLYAQVEIADGRVGWLPFSVVSTRSGTTSDDLRAQGDTAEALAALGQGGGDAAQSLVFPRLDMPHVIVNTSYLNARSGPGGEFSVVATLSGGTELEAAGIFEDGFWFLVRGSFGTGWVDTDFVLFRGSIDNVPIITAAGAASLVEIEVEVPVAIFSTSLTLYAAPGTNFGAVGFVNGPGELPVVARTSDGRWVQVSTPAGFGWVLADQVVVRGDPNLIPVVG